MSTEYRLTDGDEAIAVRVLDELRHAREPIKLLLALANTYCEPGESLVFQNTPQEKTA